jgi:hypothetical protein
MYNGQLHRLLGDIVNIAGSGRLRACDLSTYPGRRSGANGAAPAFARPSTLFVSETVWAACPPARDAGVQPMIHGRRGVSISDYRTSRICFLLRRKSTYGAGMRASRFSRRPRLPIGLFRIPAKAAPSKAMPVVFARPSVSVATYFAEGFFRRIPIRNGTVVVESIWPTAAERAHGRIDERRAMPPPRKTISLPSSQ